MSTFSNTNGEEVSHASDSYRRDRPRNDRDRRADSQSRIRGRVQPALTGHAVDVWPRIGQAFAAAHREAAKGLYR